MSNIKFNGDPVELSGNTPQVGSKIEDFTFVKTDLSEASLSDYDGKKKVLMVLPSLDTGICQKEARAFNQKLDGQGDTVGLVISKDLPMAMKRFCAAEGIETIIPASDFRYNDFGSQTGVEMQNSPLKGLYARMIYILDENNEVKYVEEVDDITHEPNYDKAIEALKSL
ncbi:MAG: lipid hydroperoxide peroxidase [Flavobacteriales bacterium]|nr:lipid hydroperoxide peroxidase [Flavobacteriales bacterium]|tara:strand:+ start:113 stop:619 length:507 start_codon:yes stop_codon:yes gene_type:complete